MTDTIAEHVQGINHLALVCSDMERTVDFYSNVLGFPLVKTVELPGGRGQHFFFDIGLPSTLAFFWFPDAPAPAPGIAHQPLPPEAPVTAIASMNHVAFNVPADKIDQMRERLVAAGVKCTPVINHDDSPKGGSREMHPGVFVRSVYFRDPDDISLELAAWTKVFDKSDVKHEPARAVPTPV